MAVFFYNVISSWIAGEKAVANPWNALSLEWQVPTPVPLENFEEIPVVATGPYGYGTGETLVPPGRRGASERWPGGGLTPAATGGEWRIS